ncbi:MAG TPA: MMPL family transporter [Kofleriaceae bacterium]|nr:MMPL family transporter [Kofleriaceae bacterium]
MSNEMPAQLARRYVAWLKRRVFVMIGVYVAVLGIALYLIAFRLPLFADFSYLLPQDVPAVRDLRKLEARTKSVDTMLVIIRAPSPQAQAAATKQMIDGITALKSPLVARVMGDDKASRDFLHSRRALLVDVADLEKARDALQHRIEQAKLKANPLYIDLGSEEDEAQQAADQKQLDELREKRREAEARLTRPTNVSPDGLVAKIEVATAFRTTDAGRAEQLLVSLGAIRAQVVASNPGVDIGFTGGAVTGLAEHRAITKGMMLSSAVTALLVALVLALYFRSATFLVLLVGTISIATAAAFGAAAITVGHLNAATAFLGAIIAGNGINYGIFLIARYLEERKRYEVDDAIAAAIAGTLRPTAVASLGAAIAYGSLAATSFKGFADFAVIGAIGMMLCWVATYTLLPALMLRFGRHTRIYHGNPIVGSMLVRLFGFKRSGMVVVAAIALFSVAGVVVVRYVAADPFEYNIKNLRSEGEDAVESRHWMETSDKNFGRGISGRTYIAADRLDQVPMIVEALQSIDANKPRAEKTIGVIDALPAYVPNDQAERMKLLADIRDRIDEAAEELEDKDKQELLELRPPDDLKPFTVDDLPPTLRERFTEKDGRVGYLIAVRPSNDLDEWNGKDLIRFATAVRELHLPDGETVTTSGSSVIFADIVTSIERDGPVVTAVALGGLIIMVVLLVGRNRRAAAVMIGTIGGAVLLIAVCALFDLKVNFLDFVALPITLGLGIDYAINVAHRHDAEDVPDPVTTLRTSGSAVLICSLTTMIGYGSLLVSENLAIRGFGTASLIGEVTTVLTALVLVPALLAIGNRRRRGSGTLASGASASPS